MTSLRTLQGVFTYLRGVEQTLWVDTHFATAHLIVLVTVGSIQLAYVVLYVRDPQTSFDFWVDTLGMMEKSRKEVGTFSIVQVGFANQEFNIELVPLALMSDNPQGIDLATPSMALRVEDLTSTHTMLQSKGVPTSDIAEMGGVKSFAFSDNENRWFAVLAT